MAESITLRAHLTGSLNDLVESANLGVLWKCSIITELVCLFADYEEEGASLFLDAFLTDDLPTLLAPIPQFNCVRLGSTTCDELGVRRAVKSAAPLVRGCWKMYLSAKADEMEFGLFRDSGHPLNVPLDVALQSGGVGDAKFIRITKLAQDSVGTVTHQGKSAIVNFTNSKETSGQNTKLIDQLAVLICSGLDLRSSQTCETYLKSLLSDAIRASHGTLIAVVQRPRVPAFLRDSTELKPVLSVSAAVDAARRDANAIPQLHAAESLVCGMFCCDVVILFDTCANIIAYNGFIKLKASNVVGGARQRAFQSLCEKLGKGLKAVFFQSHDGASDLRRSNP